jgi:hypothetical protein
MTAPSTLLSRQSQRLLQLGIILILFSSFEGFVIPYVGSPRIGLSAHTLSGFQGVFMLAVGLLWPRLNLRAAHVMGRVLAFHLRCDRDPRCLCDRRDLWRRQRDDRLDGRTAARPVSRKRGSGDPHQGGRLFVCGDRLCQLRAYLVGSSQDRRRSPHVTDILAVCLSVEILSARKDCRRGSRKLHLVELAGEPRAHRFETIGVVAPFADR